jgi:hypothetical protein
LHITLSIAEITEYDPVNIRLKPSNGGMLINIAPDNKTFPTNLFFLLLSFFTNTTSRIIETRIGR